VAYGFKGLRFINNPKLWNQEDVLHVITLANWVHNQGWDKTREMSQKNSPRHGKNPNTILR